MEEKLLHGMMAKKTTRMMAEDIIIIWHHLQAHEFLELGTAKIQALNCNRAIASNA
jgi:hypothetical protein